MPAKSTRERLVAGLGRRLEGRAVGERVGRGGDGGDGVFLGNVRDGAAQPGQLLPRGFEVLVDAGADLDLRAEELGRHLLAERLLALLHQLGRRCSKPAALQVDEVVFLLDAEREGRLLGAHGSALGVCNLLAPRRWPCWPR